ncbi:hypothetical protein OHB12_18295 [Nocardia sp. NBC_01730]|uniref:hypothetical protein n=1 Tax=Nocardia sp. NBC_01730 TaxID=2975998 RepID=UPI002E13C3B1|nr:hypothetical protein OHB12_18295 [Nocardia sp. NBC_01730]
MTLADTVTIAARNAWALTFGSGIEQPDPTPSTVLWDQPHRRLRRFEAADGGAADDDAAVLLVPPLARMETIDRFMAEMPGYPGRFYGQLWGRLILNNDIGRGVVRLGTRRIELAQVTAPVLLVGGPADVITPAAAVEAGIGTLTGAATVRYETAPGSHLGILAGPTARDTTWSYLEKFLAEAA